MTDAEWPSRILPQLAREIAIGGDLTDLPCPFCHLPRCQRSDYIRCQKCGINWLQGEDLSRDPRIERKAAYLKSVASMPPLTPQRR